MATNLYNSQKNGAEPDLVMGSFGTVTKTVILYPGQGEIKKGAVLYKDTATGLFKIAEAAQVVGTQLLVVADETKNIGVVASGAGYVIRAVFAGVLNDALVSIKGVTSITLAQELVLRQQGINLMAGIAGDGKYKQIKSDI